MNRQKLCTIARELDVTVATVRRAAVDLVRERGGDYESVIAFYDRERPENTEITPGAAPLVREIAKARGDAGHWRMPVSAILSDPRRAAPVQNSGR